MENNFQANSTVPIVIDPNSPDPNPVEHAITNTIRHGEHLVIKIISIFLLVLGINDLYEALIDIFFIYPQLHSISENQHLLTADNQQIIRSLVIFISLSFIKTVYGLSLLTRDKHLIHRIEVITSIGVLIISLTISHFAPQLDIDYQLPEIEKPEIVELLPL